MFDFFTRSRIFIHVGAKATRANVFVRFFAVDFDFHLVNVSAERTFCVAVRVAHIVAANLAFSANYANSAHCILHLPGAVFFYLPNNNITNYR